MGPWSHMRSRALSGRFNDGKVAVGTRWVRTMPVPLPAVNMIADHREAGRCKGDVTA